MMSAGVYPRLKAQARLSTGASSLKRGRGYTLSEGAKKSLFRVTKRKSMRQIGYISTNLFIFVSRKG